MTEDQDVQDLSALQSFVRRYCNFRTTKTKRNAHPAFRFLFAGTKDVFKGNQDKKIQYLKSLISHLLCSNLF